MRKGRYQGHWETMLKNCELHLNDEEFYGTLGALSTLNYAEAKRKIDDMLHKKMHSKTGMQLYGIKLGELTTIFLRDTKNKYNI